MLLAFEQKILTIVHFLLLIDHATQLHPFLKEVRYHITSTDDVFFDERGESASGYDILNWFTLPNDTLINRKVGRVYMRHPSIEPFFFINSTRIVWQKNFKKVRIAMGLLLWVFLFCFLF